MKILRFCITNLLMFKKYEFVLLCYYYVGIKKFRIQENQQNMNLSFCVTNLYVRKIKFNEINNKNDMYIRFCAFALLTC